MRIWSVFALAMTLASVPALTAQSPGGKMGKCAGGSPGGMMGGGMQAGMMGKCSGPQSGSMSKGPGGPKGPGMFASSPPGLYAASAPGRMGGQLMLSTPAVNMLTTAQQQQQQLIGLLEALEGVVGDERLSVTANRKLATAVTSARTKVKRTADQLSGVEERDRRGLKSQQDQQRLMALVNQQQLLIQALEPYREAVAQAMARKIVAER